MRLLNGNFSPERVVFMNTVFEIAARRVGRTLCHISEGS
jgi:hypothetical protein